jgi:hypothetical protein
MCDRVANAIAALGFCAPILIGRDSLVLDGAARLEAARSSVSNACRAFASSI